MPNLDFQELLQKEYKIFVDTSSLMQMDSEHVFYNIICPDLSRFNQKIIVPQPVLNEIDNHLQKRECKQAVKIINEFHKHQLYHIEASSDVTFADNIFLSLFTKHRLKYNLCLITNDTALAQEIRDLKTSKAVHSIKDIKLFYIKDKQLKEWYPRHNTTIINTKKPNFQFSLPNSPKNTKDNKTLNISIIPKAKDTITDQNGQSHKLIQELASGGEGIAYRTNTDLICKIYKQEKNTKFKKEKIELFINHSIQVAQVCLPKATAYNSKQEFIGYLMPQAQGYPLQTSLFQPQLLNQKFPTMNKWHLVTIAINLLQKIQKLHSYNIILGDINPQNILVQDENKIFIIDTDSFQIEDYPCTVGMIRYTKPIHHGKRYEDYLRTKEDDIFALFTIIFQLMLPGKQPYSFTGGTTLKENMKPENFPYKFGKQQYKGVPEGRWKAIWSHLPYQLKVLFGRFFKNQEEINLDEMFQSLKNYLYQLETGSQTTEIMPSAFKQVDKSGNVITKKCSSCDDYVDDPKKDKCKNCRGELITCKICNKTFIFSENEQRFFDKKGIPYPKKCHSCRKKKNKQNKNDNDDGTGWGWVIAGVAGLGAIASWLLG